MADYKKLKQMLNPYSSGKSLVETAGEAIQPYMKPVMDTAGPMLEKAQPVLDVLNKPTELAVQGLDYITGGEGNADSLADITTRLNKELPEEYQNDPLAKDIGYAADFLAPSPTKFLKTMKMMNKGAKTTKTAAEVYKDAKLANKIPVLSDASRATRLPETIKELAAAERDVIKIGKVENVASKSTPSTLRELLGIPKEQLPEHIGTVKTINTKEFSPKQVKNVQSITEQDVLKLYAKKYAKEVESARGKLDDDTFKKIQQSRLASAKEELTQRALNNIED